MLKSLLSSRMFRLEIPDFYEKGEFDDLCKGMSALIAYKRIANCIETGLGLPVEQMVYWTEERSPNHHKYIKTPKWPVASIKVKGPATRTQEIINYPRFEEFNLGIIVASNSSGGMQPNSIEDYAYSIYHNTNNPIRDYEDAQNKIAEQFGKEEFIDYVDNTVADYVRLTGFDAISQGRIYLEIGNIPRLKKVPSKFSKVISGFKPKRCADITYVKI
ncbi:MAG: hypothetical protein WC781_02170 [Candidatus Pacearchaeota archaeon]|jgi:hypothetical protein